MEKLKIQIKFQKSLVTFYLIIQNDIANWGVEYKDGTPGKKVIGKQ